MDTSETMEYLEDASILPELSFDDFLDPSPVKKDNKFNSEEDILEFGTDGNSKTNDTLNTPGHKKPQTIQRNTSTTVSITGASKNSTPVRTQAVKLGNSSGIVTNVIKNNTGTTTAPVLLNAKNILPKTSAQLSNNSIKLTPKTVANNTSTTNLSLSAKTAVRTSNGKIIYIQKTPSVSNVKATSTSNSGKPQTSTPVNNPKTMTIQVIRTAEGNYVPIKSATAGANGKNTTLTLSPTSLAGKKIITSAGGQMIIKGAIKTTDSIAATTSTSATKTVTTNAITSVKTIQKPATSTTVVTDPDKPKPIVVHGTGGKKILVSNQNIVKLSPKPQKINTTAGGTGSVATTSTSSMSQVHAIQIPGKIGVQYVRVLPNSKVAAKTLNTTSAPSTTSTVSTISKTVSTTNQPVKILNSLPQKFTVVQKSGATKLLVTQKKETATNSGGGEVSNTTSKIQKTIVTVPTIKSLNDDRNKGNQQQQQQQQQPLVKSTQSSLLSGNNNTSQAIVRKHKISEINTEIQKMTTSSDHAGPPEVKKPAPNNRVVVISNNTQPKILNNTIQQPGRITATLATPTQTKTISNSAGGSMVQSSNVTQNGNKLYTILKPTTQEQKSATKLYSVLKTNNQTTTSSTASTVTSAPTSTTVLSTTTTTSSNAAPCKPLINKQYLIQQQKLLQQKQQDESMVETFNARTITSKYVLPVKIKEEPTELNSMAHSNTPDMELLASNNIPSEKDDVDTMDNLVGGVRRKHCNCSKSQCLKLYCDCFANGEFCQDCTCKDCCNNLENEDERQRAIKSCLERNPNAFKPKITSSKDQSDMRLHNKGCNCKRSGCLKNYCECYEAKIPCSSNCKCVGCRNVEDRPDLDLDPIDPKIIATIAMASGDTMNSQKRGVERLHRDLSGGFPGLNIKTEKQAKENVKSFGGMDYMSGSASSPTPESQQCNFITQEVIDATIQCMLTQADECEKNGLPVYQTEKLVMEELGRCLVEIIDFSIRNTENSYSQD